MKREIEIYKIGTLLPKLPSREKPLMMVVSDAGEPCDAYVKILRERCSGEYSFMKTQKAIIGTPKMGMRGHVYEGHSIKGKEDASPMEGQPYTINSGSWHTSRVDKIVDGCVLITKNSVYAIHDLAEIRNKKLDELGI
jgi:hypothetical protein